MAFTEATSLSPQRFYDYLSCLREEFENRFDDLSPHRFNIYLQNLKGEFELKSLEIASLRKERDVYREAVKRELQDVRHNFVCERCHIATQTIPSSISRRSFQSELRLDKPGRSDTWEDVDFIQVTKRPESEIKSQIIASLPRASTSTVDPGTGPEEPDCLIKFNDIEKELDVEIVHTLSHEKLIWCVKFSRDGKYLAAGCSDGKAYIYDVQAGTLTRVLRDLLAEENRINAVCFTHDGKYLATGSHNGGLYIWEVAKKHVRNAFKGHTRHINSLDFSPNGRLLVSTSGDNTVRLWNMHDGAIKFLTTGIPTFVENPFYTSAVFSPDGRYVATSHRDGSVRIWDVRTGYLTRKMKAHTDWAICVVFTPDGKGLLSGGLDEKLWFWDVRSLDSTQFHSNSQTTRRTAPGVEEQSSPGREFIGQESIVSCLAISPDGRWVASGSYDRGVRIWDIRSAVTRCILKHDDRIRAVDFSSTGCYLASGERGGTLRIWRYSNGSTSI